MNTLRTFYFWHHTPSPHIAPFIRALSNQSGGNRITVILTGDLTQNRLNMGWHIPDYEQAQVITKPSEETIQSILLEAPENTVHLFSEIIVDTLLMRTLKLALKRRGTVGIISEGRDPRGMKGIVRRIQSLWLERPLAKRVDFVLAIGHLSSQWYGLCGFPKEKIFPFCYIVDTPTAHLSNSPPTDESVQISYVGQLIPRKRVDLLLQALFQLQNHPWKLDIVGSGPEYSKLVKLSAPFAHRVQFHGNVDNRKVREMLAETDLLILPSHWDGWGAVVNEALLAGARVVCSEHCGAADLLADNHHQGLTFSTDSAFALQTAIEQVLSKGKITESERNCNKAHAQMISGPSIADYYLSILRYLGDRINAKKPTPPWYPQ